jgi:carboxyl-terminal processing protease
VIGVEAARLASAVLLLGAALLGLAARSAHAQGPALPAFDAALAADVYAAALGFMVPRILEPEPAAQLTAWGLHGLTALDPRLDPKVTETEITLALNGRTLRQMPAPAPDDATGWAQAAAQLAEVALPVSPAVQRAGTQGIMRNFFDEVFNHLDPYSRYEPPEAATEDRDNRSGEAGAGMTVTAGRGGAIVVSAVIADSPAATAGLRAGDRILSVDGQPTRGQSAAAVASLIAGPEGSTLSLSWRGRDGRTHDADLVRALVPPESVFAQRFGDTLVLRIATFNRTTQTHLAILVHDALAAPQPPAGLVLDLRGNRGGLLLQAVAAADLFLDGGPIALTAGRDPQAAHVFRASSKPSPIAVPVVVLVDGRTASSAEILAAALADRGRAVVVGSTTFGKGLVQTVATMPDGGELFVTWSWVIAPRGWPLQGLGVLPQICTSVGQADVQQQLHALQDGQAPMAEAIAVERATRTPVPAAQAVAIRSACPAAEGRELDAGVARWLIDHPAGYAAALLPQVSEP